MEPLLTAREAARLLRINVYVLYALARRKQIPVVRINRMVRFRLEDLESWITQRRTA
jgi:excisionase family DNA binding protein